MKKSILILLILVNVVVGFLLTKNTTEGQQANSQDSDDEPTVVQLGNRTTKEKAYSKKYSNYADPELKLDKGIKLAKEKGFKGEIKRFVFSEVADDSSQLTTSEFISHVACNSDAVVFGTVKSKTAHLTEDESWAYTEYEFLVKEILKNNLDSPIGQNSSIQITRPGGLVKIDNQIFRIKDSLFEQLKKNKEYLLFLSYVPETDGYMTASYSRGDFELVGNRFFGISKLHLPEELKTDNSYKAILDKVRNSVGNDCSRWSKGGN